MASIDLLLRGGPCDGETKTVDLATARQGEIVCKGTVYVPDPATITWPPEPPYPPEPWVTQADANRTTGGVPVELFGGPCAGKVLHLSEARAARGSVVCQQTVYVPDPRDTNWPPVKPYTLERWVTATEAQKIIGTAPAVKAKNASGAWLRLMFTLALYAPRQITRQRQATAGIRRIARRAGKG